MTGRDLGKRLKMMKKKNLVFYRFQFSMLPGYPSLEYNGFVSYHVNTIQFRSWLCKSNKGKSKRQTPVALCGAVSSSWACPTAQTATEWTARVVLPGGAERGHLNGPLSGGDIYSPSLVTLLKARILEASLTGEMKVNQTCLSERVRGTGALKSPQGTD